VLDKLGTSRLAARLGQAGAALVLPKHEAPGLAMGLGGVGITLSDLVMLYAGLARQGEARALIEREATSAPDRRLLDPVAAWYIGNILIGAPPPDNAPRNRLAFKTGTSYGYRDAWAIGFDRRYTIGVWVGRPDGAPVPGLIGRHTAAPILFDAFARTGATPEPLARAPEGALTVTTGKLPPPLQRYRPGGLANANSNAPRIMFPPDGVSLAVSGVEPAMPVALKVSGGVGRLTVLLDGMPIPAQNSRQTLFFRPGGRGFVRLTVMDSRGSTDSVMVRIE
jgi:penicillin-binding protein 1C